METNHIDSLLERYLVLLDEYTALRERLSGTQAGIYQNIARANFSAERGVRYGPDYYDERMRASRTLEVAVDDTGVPHFEVVKVAEGGDAVTDPKTEATEAAAATATKNDDVDEAPSVEPEGVASVGGGQTEKEAEEKDEAENEKEKTKQKKKKKKSNDPLRWFGILAPMPLRQAQSLSVQAMQDIIPRLVSVDAEMKDIEIEVRRARKRRAKAEAAALKSHDVDEGAEAVRRETQAPMAAV
ncbi:hypothetical protein HER10_EVM0002334 [Colletotrichum scovillei]|uniref:Vacuolar ATPase assembly protein VMA22 n=1 Tax=Colletotrichum scovillei TaxID=1209932 RepID=A0A9P7UDR5_9PEZI|nr:uncharacterized protein HER10_EVM0002334 [Colletotrichum scovillei]KAF4782731.1 hypothetical protein HER10_EVM0002334 [Colletotrichum scovillei]KAG7051351.1 hypothetical protein JMJ77_0001975 [Colletotrichum scovillei]KAG7070388.1 hypothetical protein JMJ76_0001641 [Colletotrichum scovillei]KAG7078662.1 hypothetical protein JMJ78_0002331 [Colletotrichum scovillei]